MSGKPVSVFLFFDGFPENFDITVDQGKLFIGKLAELFAGDGKRPVVAGMYPVADQIFGMFFLDRRVMDAFRCRNAELEIGG